MFWHMYTLYDDQMRRITVIWNIYHENVKNLPVIFEMHKYTVVNKNHPAVCHGTGVLSFHGTVIFPPDSVSACPLLLPPLPIHPPAGNHHSAQLLSIGLSAFHNSWDHWVFVSWCWGTSPDRMSFRFTQTLLNGRLPSCPTVEGSVCVFATLSAHLQRGHLGWSLLSPLLRALKELSTGAY